MWRVQGECWNSEAVIARQQEGRHVSVDIDSQQYKAIAMIWHSKQYMTVGQEVVSVGTTRELYTKGF
jgi:hypothetical protein